MKIKHIASFFGILCALFAASAVVLRVAKTEMGWSPFGEWRISVDKTSHAQCGPYIGPDHLSVSLGPLHLGFPPSPEAQQNGFFDVRFVGRTDDGRELRAKVTGDRDPGYGSTAKMLGESAYLVREFFQTYYHPANASLSLAGDVETEQAFELAEKYFGGLPAAPVLRSHLRLTR